MSNKFHICIKNVVESQGKEVIKTTLLANILADYGAYEEYPTTKIVLKELLNQGIGLEIYNILSANYQVSKEFDKLKNDFQKKTNFKTDIVSYIFNSFLFAFDKIRSIEEPYSQGFDPYASDSDGILEKLPKMLESLKKEYNELLDSLLVKPSNLIWDAPAYYTVSGENKLFLIEGKIAVIANQLGITNLGNWCKSQKAQKLNIYLTRKRNAAKELLDSKKNDYIHFIKKAFRSPAIGDTGQNLCFDENEISKMMSLEKEIVGLFKEQGLTYDNWCQAQKSALITKALDTEKNTYISIIKNALVIPSSKIISKSAYFKPERLVEIEAREKLIVGMYNEKGEAYNGWCEKEKEKILAPYSVSKSKQIRQACLKILLPLSIIGGTGSQYVSYNMSSDSIDKYNQIISNGDTQLSAGNYGKAISCFLSAGDGYNASYNTSSYKNDAISKAENAFEELQNKVETQISNKQYKIVLDEINSIPAEFVEITPKSKEWIDKTKVELVDAVDKEVTNLAEFIANNNGKLGPEGKKLIDDLLSVSPDNYWLRLLKNKE